MNVRELIQELQKIENKDLPIYLETEDIDTMYVPTTALETRDYVVMCTCFEEVKA